MAKKNGKKYHFAMSIFSMTFWGFCLVVLLVWIFVLGIMVGKSQDGNSMPILSNFKKPIEPVPPPAIRTPSSPPPEPVKVLKKEEPPPKLEFYEKLEEKKEPLKITESSGGPATASASKNGKIKFEPLRKEKSLPREQVATSGSTRKEPVSNSPPAPYTIQLASLEGKEKAEKMVQNLKTHGHDAYYYDAKIQGKVYYRVRCGRFATREEASIYAVKLANEENLQGFVTKVE